MSIGIGSTWGYEDYRVLEIKPITNCTGPYTTGIWSPLGPIVIQDELKPDFYLKDEDILL